ncbi:MAG TPA: ATP-binding protein [Anaerolineae bacterium]|nr:ATP-binding protein [Anaerolineae bacterium]
MSERFIRQFPAKLSMLVEIRRYVEDTAAGFGANDSALLDVVQAVDESAANIIMHGYRGGPGTIDVEIRRERDSLTVCLRDRAPLFDPTRVPAPDLRLPLDQRPLGGMGIYLTRKFVDELAYRVTPEGGNELTLRKSLSSGQ